MSNKILLLSINPEFAEKIFNGTKTVELRRIKPNLKKDDIVLIYVTSPISALSGKFEVHEVIFEKPKNLWDKVKFRAGISKKKFNQYYENSGKGCAIFFQKVYRFPNAIKLSKIKEIFPNFHPPQSYQYIKEKYFNIFKELNLSI